VSDFVWNGDQIVDEISARIDADAHIVGSKVVEIAQRLAHKRTGAMAASIAYQYDSSTHTLSWSVGPPPYGKNKGGYGIFEELGTRYRPAHPFLRPAINMVGSGGQLASGANIYGFATEMLFTNVPVTDKELLFGGGRYIGGKGLTERQKHHVRTSLKPAAERHNVGNVRRSGMRVQHRC
jgi:HK97 gp10 family phage protein